MRLSALTARLGTETAFEVLSRARQLEARGRRVLHLELGEPDFPTPRHIREAARRALEEGYTYYTPSAGLPELREAIARHVSRTRGIPVDPEEVVVTPGAKPVLTFGILALVDPGDEVIYPDPGFPIYESVIRWAGARPIPLPLREENGFRVDPEELRRLVTPRTRLLILNSPHNPCGSVLEREELRAIAEICLEHDLFVLSDEIYSRIVYEGEHQSIVSLPGMRERTLLLDGFSKAYAMTGWRLGYGVMPRPLAEAVTRFAVNVHSCAPAMVQRAGLAALEGPQEEVDRMVAEFRRRRDSVVAALNGLEGIRCAVPRGAFYAFPNVSALDPEGDRFAAYLLEEAGVAVLSGTAFGPSGRGHLRISYAAPLAHLEEALYRVREAARSFHTLCP
ncbi:MAG: pyridoxal phosphate-dependent aminotransferase [Armatimonadota bacterium]|nr:pyridoxal phosphate-dependent aminotransferase [Armatimonadota bacterium]